MTRNLIAGIIILSLCAYAAATARALPMLTLELDEEIRLQRLAEQRVMEFLASRPQLMVWPPRVARIAGSAVLDPDHVQVDVVFTLPPQAGEAPQTAERERFLFKVSDDTVRSLGQPTGEVAILPVPRAGAPAGAVRSAVLLARKDALERYSTAHPGTGPDVGCGTEPRVRTTVTDPVTGEITVACETFGGFAGTWLGEAVSYVYSPAAEFVRVVGDLGL
jgi:hypothetical protein